MDPGSEVEPLLADGRHNIVVKVKPYCIGVGADGRKCQITGPKDAHRLLFNFVEGPDTRDNLQIRALRNFFNILSNLPALKYGKIGEQ